MQGGLGKGGNRDLKCGQGGTREKESRGETTSEAQGSRFRTSGGLGGTEPTATEGQEAWTQGTVGVMLLGEEGDVGDG